MYCWLSALAMTCFADYQSYVLLSTWRQTFRWISYISAPLSMKYILLITGSRHDVFRWLSTLCAIVIMASDNSLIIRAVCSLFHEICLVDYQLSPWHVSLIITSLCYSRHVVRYFADYQNSMLHSPWNMSCWISTLAVTCFADYHSSVLLLPWREIIHWLSEPCHSLSMTSYHSLNAIVTKPKIFPFGVNTTIELKSVTTASDSTAKTVSWDTPC